MTQTTNLKVRGVVVVTLIRDQKGEVAAPLSADELRSRLRDGSAVEVYRGPNIITEYGLSLLSRLMTYTHANSSVVISNVAGAAVTVTSFVNSFITRMKIGNDSAATSPTPADLALYQATPYENDLMVSRSALSQTPDYTQALFRGTIPAVSAATTLYEEGLFFWPDGDSAYAVMFARVLFSPGIVKPASTAVQIDHQINFDG